MTRYQIQIDLEVESGLTQSGVEDQVETVLTPFDDDLTVDSEVIEE